MHHTAENHTFEFIVSALDPAQEGVHQLEVGLPVLLEEAVQALGQDAGQVLTDQLVLHGVYQLPLGDLVKVVDQPAKI